jgi:multiple sugar transport system substrate-binding protein
MRSTVVSRAAALVAAAVLLPGCSGTSTPGPGSATTADTSAAANGGRRTISVWYHSGQGPERESIETQVREFNAAQDKVKVDLVLLPEGSYNDQVEAAAKRNKLPDLLDFDGPNLYSYVGQGKLAPIDTLITAAARDDLLESVRSQGTFRGRLYSAGTYDSGLGIYGRRSLLEAAGVRIPTSVGTAWTAAEFERALAALARRDTDGKVLDVKLSYGIGEWYTYGFSPVVWSAGGRLVSSDMRTAEGQIDSPKVLRAMKTLQRWIRTYVDPNPGDDAFQKGRVALSWVGHWQYQAYREAFGNDLVVMPLPDFGHGSKTGQGSWNWGISGSSPNKEAAAAFLSWLLTPEQVLKMSGANGAVPGTKTALARSPLYHGGPLSLFAEQLEKTCGSGPIDRSCVAVPRPATASYPTITSAFQQAFKAVVAGEDVDQAFAQAATTIDAGLRGQ